MSGDWELTGGAFDELLRWLDDDRERAARKYEAVRLGLIKMFTGRGCAAAEDLADETINRVARKLSEIKATYVGNPEKYFYGVAKMVYREYQRQTERLVPLPDNVPGRAGDDTQDELTYACLESCIEKLPPDQRELLRQYFLDGADSAQRRALAKRLGITMNTLRVRVFRIESRLEACVKKCVRRGGG